MKKIQAQNTTNVALTSYYNDNTKLTPALPKLTQQETDLLITAVEDYFSFSKIKPPIERIRRWMQINDKSLFLSLGLTAGSLIFIPVMLPVTIACLANNIYPAPEKTLHSEIFHSYQKFRKEREIDSAHTSGESTRERDKILINILLSLVDISALDNFYSPELETLQTTYERIADQMAQLSRMKNSLEGTLAITAPKNGELTVL